MLRDRVRPPVRILFVGINPGLRSEAIGHHFAGYSNRFWKLLFESGLVSERLGPGDDVRLPEWGYGITNLVPRATAGIDTLRPQEYAAGLRVLTRKVRRWKPAVVALVGVTLYRKMFEQPAGRAIGAQGRRKSVERRLAAPLGLREETFEGARVFVLPNPSGRNANYSHAEMLRAFRELAEVSGGHR